MVGLQNKFRVHDEHRSAFFDIIDFSDPLYDGWNIVGNLASNLVILNNDHVAPRLFEWLVLQFTHDIQDHMVLSKYSSLLHYLGANHASGLSTWLKCGPESALYTSDEYGFNVLLNNMVYVSNIDPSSERNQPP